ncbi:MAG TPA: spermidine/putrescine ABC transporter ATP-binding protein, partial [Acidobacteria bacterium]|nr:spermidine/putrescine ABC transporter ATP-binding protein [Acidobacteriota bacterium]
NTTPTLRLPAHKRNVGVVFQNYALFPHLTVGQNVAYPLTVRKVPKAEQAQRVEKALAMVRLDGKADRLPGQLSGGQQQRVALARALVFNPQLVLMDEPLGALDLKLREQMQVELKALQQQVGITFVYVTHDQEEALAMSDRLAVFHRGRIEQVGAPAEVYETPATEFVAGFVGVSNLVAGTLARALTGTPQTFSLRPEKIRLAPPETPVPAGSCAADGTLRDVVYLGMRTRYGVALDAGGVLTVEVQNLETTSMEALARRGSRVRLLWSREQMHRLGPEGDA